LELPNENSMTFSPGEGFEVLEFGSDAAKKCLEWMENDFDRGEENRYLRLYFSAELQPSLDGVLAELKNLDESARLISLKEEEDVDYQAEFRKNFRGSSVGKNYWVGPTWESPPAGRRPVFIEPGMAFGTGDHPTTQLCISFLEDLFESSRHPHTIFDLGSGTGVLAIVARQLFPQAKIWASDLDPQCAEDFSRALVMNQISATSIQAQFGPAGDIRKMRKTLPPIDLLISNIYAEVLSGLIEEIDAALSPGAHWIVSGILEGPQSHKFIEIAKARGFQLLETRSQKRQRSLFEKKNGLTLEEETWLGLKFIKSK
jgi:ribosomal protein L11 methyltransferase